MKTKTISAPVQSALLAGVLGALLALPALAQETAPEAAPETAPEATGTVAADAAAADGLSMGTEVGAAPQVGDSYVAAAFDDWEQRCIKTDLGADPCQLYQLLKDDQGNSVAEFSIFTLPEGTEGPAVAGATFIAPLETLLTAGLLISVDGGKPRAYPFTFCASIGCVARIGFTADEVTQFKKGANTALTIVPFVAQDQKVVLNASLKGFTAGLDAVTAANKAADAAAAAAGANPAPAP